MLPLLIAAGVVTVAGGAIAGYSVFHQPTGNLPKQPKRTPNPEEPDEQYGWEVSKNNRIPILPKNPKISGKIDSSYVTIAKGKEKRYEVRTVFQDPNTQRKSRYRYITNSKGEQTGNTHREEYDPENRQWNVKIITPYQPKPKPKNKPKGKTVLPKKPTSSNKINSLGKGKVHITQ
jgi:hypothetical protein